MIGNLRGPAAALICSPVISKLAQIHHDHLSSSARLAALYPQSGGTYVYGR
jgi:hypothetical protein